ncbi:MAG: nuclear transport factor 2 family protein [Verrucomicrobia bacterium]|nr:nuclear transport factor 2 family protein [Verrucomicrobiota bacterium]
MIRLLLAFLFTLTCPAAEHPELARVAAADDARVAAMLAPTRAKLDAVLSPELRYAHSNGQVDTKEALIASLTDGSALYSKYAYQERRFTFPAPGLALMAGRFDVKAVVKGNPAESTISYLAVWRLEEGRWKFLAWQSCKVPPAAK